MRIRAIRDAAAAMRGRRLDLGLSQAELARRAGISRKWIVEFEAGKPTAELGIVLRVAETLGLEVELVPADAADTRPRPIDLDALIDAHRRG